MSELKIYSIKTGDMKHDINHDCHMLCNRCIHCHFTLYDYRYMYISMEEYIDKYTVNILQKIHTGCKYPQCCICERIQSN
jgi:hypothetical protein